MLQTTNKCEVALAVIFTYLWEIHAFIHFIFQRKCIIKQVRIRLPQSDIIPFSCLCFTSHLFDYSFVNVCDLVTRCFCDT